MSPSDNKLIDELKRQAASFPRKPGVYIMRDAKAEVIYVGKAKDLRARVRTYFAGGDGRSQIEFLLRRVAAIDRIITESEQQAFVLERDLITKHKPRYNIRLKDDKAYLSVRVDESAEWPRLELVRKVTQDGARYFGPYTFSYELRTLLDTIKRVIPLRTCTDTVFHNRQRPCLEYQIKRCAGPCCLPVEKQQYRAWVKQAISILQGKTADLAAELEVSMDRASKELRFEDAAAIRDRLNVLRNFADGQRLQSSRGENRDVFAIYREEGFVALALLKVRSGRISDSTQFSFRGVEVSSEEVIEAALSQYYESRRDEIPDEIVLPSEFQNIPVLERVLSERRGESIEIIVPKMGLKKRLVGLAEVNAREHFMAEFDKESRWEELCKQMSIMFKLRQVPRRVECVDISNFQGSDTVGAVVSFLDGQPDKGRYKKYKLKIEGKPDDFASIHEVVLRRLQRGGAEGDLPDLMVIDGGDKQLEMARRAMEEANVSIDLISLAKMRTESALQKADVVKLPERVFLVGGGPSIPLLEESEVTRFLQRVRDEAHRFVITFHRSRRSKRVIKSALDDILGVGPERRRRLMNHFGSVDAIRSAPVEEVAKWGRMPKPLAQKILNHLAKD